MAFFILTATAHRKRPAEAGGAARCWRREQVPLELLAERTGRVQGREDFGSPNDREAPRRGQRQAHRKLGFELLVECRHARQGP